MNPDVYATLQRRAKQALLAERMKTSAELQVGRMKEEGVPDIALIAIEEAIVMETIGLSTACFVFLGCLPPMHEFATVSKVWKYTKLHVMPDGKAPTGTDLKELQKAHKKAVKAGEKSKDDKSPGWSPRMCAHALKRLAGPCVKMCGGEDKNGRPLPFSPYRPVRDQRYDRTLFTHPPMLEEGAGCEFCDAAYEKRRKTGKGGIDCSNVGGHHWKPAHRDNDALRVTAKAILLDLWLVENGLPAVIGGHHELETHTYTAPYIGEVPVAASTVLEPSGIMQAAGA